MSETRHINRYIAALLIGAAFPATAYAQPAAEEEAQSGFAEIIVTARKSQETLTDVPIAITAVSAEQLNNRGITDVQDLAAFTPGLRFQNQSVGRNDRGFKQYVIRGIIPNSGLATRQTVTMFVDGAPVSGGNVSGVTDIERVEVIKGPQSAFFGRATFAGAINMITRAPSYEWQGTMGAEVSRFGTHDLTASVEGPIVADKLAIRVSGRLYHTDGQYKNLNYTGERLGERDTKSLSVSLRADPTENLSIRAFATRWNDSDGLSANARLGADHANCAANPASEALNFYCGKISQAPKSSQTWNPYINPVGFDALQNRTNLYGAGFINHLGLERRAQQYRMTADWGLGDWTVSAIGSYGKNKWAFLQTNGLTDTRAIPNPTPALTPEMAYVYSLTMGNTKDEDAYGEVRLMSPQDSRLSGTMGVNYFWNRTDNLTAAYTNAGWNLNTPQTINSSNTYGIFGSLKWEFIDQFSVSAEGRYQIDKLYQQSRSGSNPEFSDTFNSFSPRVILQYEPNRASSIYASYSVGNRPGEFNTIYRAQPAYVQEIIRNTANVEEAVPEDKIKMGEIGYKGMLFGNRLRVLAAAYYGMWTNRHIPNQINYVDESDNLRMVQITAANGKVEVSGIELEAAFKANDNLTLEGTFNIADTKIKRTFSTDSLAVTGNASPVGTRLPFYPKYSGSVSATYEREIADGYNGFVRADLIYTGRQYESEANLAYTAPSATVNLRVGVDHDWYRVELFGTNIFDNKTPTSLARTTETIYNPSTGANIGTNQGITVSLPDRANYGVRVTTRF